MTREEQNQAQALDLEERRRQAEEAFQTIYQDWKVWSYGHNGSDSDWVTIASEMGLTDFYKRLKDGR